ncbi:Hsp20/alpha crystallin family protein [Halobacterium jilantaiense]|uniref:Heat shock protein Hsp20 n=1 Tax=Halobacterium jilantaiense TaxID=355548 RepID=A0A1I0QGC6_9EURY|nr:Hsp20/alpha crystallin family protein [Halobacterium jilantaiense]SEW25897.1 heat shock protein Hsp20 [Halobacterium jilantaiense]
MTDRHRTTQGVPYTAAAWDATGRTPVGATTPSPQTAGSGAVASQQQAEPAEYQPPAATPSADVVESDDELVVLLDAPGFEEDQITVHADANNVYVTADRSDDAAPASIEGGHALLQERPLRLERAIALPGHVDPEQATAEHDNGVCRISVPKDEDDRRHEIGFQ